MWTVFKWHLIYIFDLSVGDQQPLFCNFQCPNLWGCKYSATASSSGSLLRICIFTCVDMCTHAYTHINTHYIYIDFRIIRCISSDPRLILACKYPRELLVGVHLDDCGNDWHGRADCHGRFGAAPGDSDQYSGSDYTNENSDTTVNSVNCYLLCIWDYAQPLISKAYYPERYFHCVMSC